LSGGNCHSFEPYTAIVAGFVDALTGPRQPHLVLVEELARRLA